MTTITVAERAVAVAMFTIAFAGCIADPVPPEGDAGVAPFLACLDPCPIVVDSGQRFEPSVAVDPNDPLHIVAASIDTSLVAAGGASTWWPLVHVSRDGGETWSTQRAPGGPSAGPAHPLFRYNAMGDPVVAILEDGDVLLWAIADARVDDGVLTYTKTGDSLVQLRSLDGGSTFPELVFVKEGAGVSSEEIVNAELDEQDKQWFALGPDGTILLTWVRILGDDPHIVFSTSGDAGQNWSPPTTIASGPRLQGPYPMILADGTWLVSYVDQGDSRMHLARSFDQGATWSSSELARSTKFPVMAQTSGPGGERVVLAYPATEGGLDSAQTTTVRWSDDGGITWSAPVPLHVAQAAGPTIPAIAASPDGKVYVTFWQPRDGGADYMAVALRDGWLSEPLHLDATQGWSGDTGHYMGLALTPGGGAFAVWNAQRGAEFQIMAARLTA